nr:carbohydrate binding domain-containing protein [Streptomyces sp. V4I2]
MPFPPRQREERGPSAGSHGEVGAPVAIDRFEGEVPFANPPAEGIFTWGSDTDDPPALRLTAREDAPEGDKVLTGTYDISGYGGFTHDFLTTLGKAPEGGATTLKALAVAAAVAEKAGAEEAGRALVTKARLVVQQKVGQDITAAVAKPFADADHLLLTERYGKAVEKLTTAYRAS